MTQIAGRSGLSCNGGGWAGNGGIAGKHDRLRQGKSACPEHSKPLTWLVFSRACRAVAGILPEYRECFQRFDMHGLPLAAIESRP